MNTSSQQKEIKRKQSNPIVTPFARGRQSAIARPSHLVCISVLCALFLILQLNFVSVAFGAEEAAHGAEAADGAAWKEWLWKIVNFAILVVILVKFVGKPLKEFLRKRTEVIEKTLQEARQAKELAQKALTEVEERLKYKDKEIEDILAASLSSAKLEQDSLVLQGVRMRDKILEQAQTGIEYGLRQAKEEIRAEAVEIAMEMAENKLKEKLTPDTQDRLIEESLAKIEGKQ
jgi:F-type H+-transporting ATPase subunit b